MSRRPPLPPFQASSLAATTAMRANRRVDTALETRVRSALHRKGKRFRKDYYIKVPGSRTHADIAFPRPMVAVFLDGCYWHRCPDHCRVPKSNSDYWSAKLDRNFQRDEHVTAALKVAGWTVVRIWEHVAAEDAVNQILAALEGTKAPKRAPQASDWHSSSH